jgi:hypothetical protein
LGNHTAAASRGSRHLLAPLAPLAVMLGAGALIVGSGATFSSTTSSASNVVTAGAFTQTNTADGSAIFTMSTAKPGDTVTGTATVTNTGDFAGDFTLVEEDALNGFPVGDLDLVVSETIGVTTTDIHTGTISDLGSISLGRIEPGASRTYDFTVTLDATAGDDAQGDSASAVYTWNAVQSA